MTLLIVFYALMVVVVVSSGLATLGFFSEVQIFGAPVLVIVAMVAVVMVAVVIDYFIMMSLIRCGKPRKKGGKK